MSERGKFCAQGRESQYREERENQKRQPAEQQRDGPAVTHPDFYRRDVDNLEKNDPGRDAQRRSQNVVQQVDRAADARRREQLQHLDRARQHGAQDYWSDQFETPEGKKRGRAERDIDRDVDGRIENRSSTVYVEIPGVQQEMDRAMGEGMRLKAPRV